MTMLPLEAGRMNGTVDRARRFFSAFTPGQKAVTILGLVGLVLGGFVFFSRASAPSYTTLFANLQPQDAGAITQKLASDHVPYQLANGGTTILVPQADVNQERISLAQAGLPSGGTITFQTLASTGITSSQFVQNVDYQQALEGQLASTIESIQGVNHAQVSLVMPNTTSFAIGNTQTPTASVLVGLGTGSTLSSGQVQAIVHLVASSVPGLEPNNVTVVDNSGDVLSAPGVDASSSANSQQTTAYDNELGASLTSLLAHVVGPGNAAVQVHALLNFNQVHTTTNSLATGPGNKPLVVPTSTSSTKQTFKGSGSQAAGVLGSTGAAVPANQNGTYSSTQTQVNNAVGQVNTTVQQAPGQVQQTSVAVLLNSSAKGAKNLAQIRNLVTAAAGLHLKAGDTLVVSSLPFSPTAQTPQAPAPNMLDKLKSIGPSAAFLLLILGIFLFALRSAKKRSPVYEEIPLAALEMRTNPANAQTIELPSVPPSPAIAKVEDLMPEDLDAYIKESPSEIAGLMRIWASERPTLGAPDGNAL